MRAADEHHLARHRRRTQPVAHQRPQLLDTGGPRVVDGVSNGDLRDGAGAVALIVHQAQAHSRDPGVAGEQASDRLRVMEHPSGGDGPVGPPRDHDTAPGIDAPAIGDQLTAPGERAAHAQQAVLLPDPHAPKGPSVHGQGAGLGGAVDVVHPGTEMPGQIRPQVRREHIRAGYHARDAQGPALAAGLVGSQHIGQVHRYPGEDPGCGVAQQPHPGRGTQVGEVHQRGPERQCPQGDQQAVAVDPRAGTGDPHPRPQPDASRQVQQGAQLRGGERSTMLQVRVTRAAAGAQVERTIGGQGRGEHLPQRGIGQEVRETWGTITAAAQERGDVLQLPGRQLAVSIGEHHPAGPQARSQPQGAAGLDEPHARPRPAGRAGRSRRSRRAATSPPTPASRAAVVGAACERTAPALTQGGETSVRRELRPRSTMAAP